MDERNDTDNNNEDVIMPGFRFHPTDEELVGFYLKRKIQQRPLHIELIKQVDIYKYDPWDLPRLAATGEKEWYFYCPRDRKYRNSARPNRVTGGGFWKATGTDRPIYSSDGNKCIGLKKSLVFYRGRAAKGTKTDWMMHEFRLPSTFDPALPKKFPDKNFSAIDSWAICRIFKKMNSIAQRSLSQAWVAPFSETGSPDMFTQNAAYSQLYQKITPCTTKIGSNNIHLCDTINDSQRPSTVNFSTLNTPSCKIINGMMCKPSFSSPIEELPYNFMFSAPEICVASNKCAIDISSMLFNSSPGLTMDNSNTSGSVDFERPRQQLNSFLIISSQEMQESISMEENEGGLDKWENTRSVEFPFSLTSNLLWDSPACPSETSTTYSTNKSYK